jgi:hypothetical protein
VVILFIFWEKARTALVVAFVALLAAFGLEVSQNDWDLGKFLQTKSFQESKISRDDQGNILFDKFGNITTDKTLGKKSDDYNCSDFSTQPEAQQNLLLTTSTYGDYSYGDYIVVTGKIKPARQFDDFDYQKYLERFNVYGLMSYPKILVLKKHQASIIRDKVFQTKYFLVSKLARYTSEPNLSLLLGILIGARKTLPLEIVNNFTATGVSHIVAVSGYNISIIILALEKMSWWIGRKPAFWTSLIIIIMFVIMTGASSSVIRAAVMGSLVLFGFASGRPGLRSSGDPARASDGIFALVEAVMRASNAFASILRAPERSFSPWN